MFFSRRRNLPLATPLTLDSSPLTYVSQFRFLGLLFDSHLTWHPHCVALRKRCAKDLFLLRIVSSRGWGADSVTLSISLFFTLLPEQLWKYSIAPICSSSYYPKSPPMYSSPSSGVCLISYTSNFLPSAFTLSERLSRPLSPW